MRSILPFHCTKAVVKMSDFCAHRKLQIEQSETSLMSRTAQAKVQYETNLIKSFTTSVLSLIKMPFHMPLPSGIDVLSQTITEPAYLMNTFIPFLQKIHFNFLH